MTTDSPFRIESSWRRLRRSATAVLLSSSLLTPGLPQAQPAGIPSMGTASSTELSPALETLLGKAIMEQGRRDPTYINDPDVRQYLAAMGAKLSGQASGLGQPVQVFGVRDPQINAFALPGGYVGVNSGLVVQSESESELASVVAHEIAHVAQRHIARGMTQGSQSNTIMMASIAAALLAAMAGSGDLAMGVAAFGQAAAIDQQLGFSRQAEQEADRLGLEMMRKAGFDPRGMARMFGRLSSVSRLNESMSGGGYHSTHPLSVQRMSDIENRVRELPQQSREDGGDYLFVRAKLRVIQAKDARSQREVRETLQHEASTRSGAAQAAAWYGLAYAELVRGELDAADKALAQASVVKSPHMAQMRIQLALRRGADAVQMARDAWRDWPQSQGVALLLAEALQKAGKDGEGVAFLEERVGQWPEEPQFHERLAQGYERLGEAVKARSTMATYYEMVGALPTAVQQLRQARNLTDDFYLQSELDTRIRELRERQDMERELLKRFKT